MKIKSVIITTILLLMSFTLHATEGPNNALTAWTNQSGSTLYIDTIDGNGRLSGTYINRAAGYSCQNISYPVTGWIYGTAITFNTKWESFL